MEGTNSFNKYVKADAAFDEGGKMIPLSPVCLNGNDVLKLGY